MRPAGPPFSRDDLALAAAIAGLAVAVYAGLALRLAQGAFGEYDNLAFDFDAQRYVALYAGDEYERGNVKHPLIVLLRPLGLLLGAFGLAPAAAAGLLMALCGGATVGVVFVILRTIAVAAAPALALSALFAVSASQVITAMVPEAYGPAALGLAVAWLLAARALMAPAAPTPAGMPWGRLAATVAAYGITTTNVVQPLLAEALIRVRRQGLRRAIRPLVVFGLVAAAIALALTALVWADHLGALLADPLAVVREVYWQRTKGERVGLVDTVLRLLGYAVVPPRFVTLNLPEGIAMLGFRAPDFTLRSLVATVLWHGFWLVGTVAMLAQPALRWLAAGLAGVLVFNVLFHLDFQFRGSLFLYSAHVNLALFLLGCGLAPLLRPGSVAARAYLAVVVVLVLLVGSISLNRAVTMAESFDQVRAECPAPCHD